eukprot:TRINITY_DN16373_c0_g1_i1.p1 TRINITY_DN16373_c0_g1~~TRINITY_DN16373_c0_g1_i1.p1  ORF type:complete len:333 (+),score=63.79 TRINITY_DN16373_c0_g1_i1:79-999(+)
MAAAVLLLQRARALSNWECGASSGTRKGTGTGMQVFVRTPEGAMVSVEVAPDATVADVMDQLVGQHPELVGGTLSWQQAPVPRDALLADLGAGAESVFELATKEVGWLPRVEPQKPHPDLELTHGVMPVKDGEVAPPPCSIARRATKPGSGGDGRCTVLGPARPPTSDVWQWRVRVIGRDEGRSSDLHVNLYVGLTRPSIELARSDSGGLYGKSKDRLGCPVWMVVNDTAWTNCGAAVENSSFGQITDGTVVIVTHYPAESRVVFTRTDSDSQCGMGGADGELCIFMQCDKLGAGAGLLYSGPPRD